MDDIFPVHSEATKRLIAEQEAKKVAEELRKSLRDEAVHNAIRRTAWALLICMTMIPSPALAHDWYHTLIIPGTYGASCCDNQDCAPTRARHSVLGWEATIPAGAWVSVPETRIIRDKTHPAGSAVLCWRDARVICFVPPAAGG